MSGSIPLSVLLVEDSEDDLFFFRRLFAKAGLTLPLAVAMDGQKAIDYLQRSIDPTLSDRPPVPRLVFLDLKLPFKGGFEVLQWIRSRPEFADMVVVVLSSSAESRDVTQAFALGAQGYLVKYPEASSFADVVQRVSAAPIGTDLQTITLPGFLRPA
jgi:CheY-like chemotaxis protein